MYLNGLCQLIFSYFYSGTSEPRTSDISFIFDFFLILFIPHTDFIWIFIDAAWFHSSISVWFIGNKRTRTGFNSCLADAVVNFPQKKPVLHFEFTGCYGDSCFPLKTEGKKPKTITVITSILLISFFLLCGYDFQRISRSLKFWKIT